jgi:hypothetical protein
VDNARDLDITWVQIMRNIVTALTLGLLLALAGAAGAADKDFPGIRKLMSDEEFSAAGLDALSPAELEALDAWLVRYTVGEADAVRASSEEVKQAEKDIEVVSRLSADFRGWDGDTLFRLENGQVWKQRLRGRYAYTGPPAPEVRITRNFLGFFKMTVVETGSGIGVSRVR